MAAFDDLLSSSHSNPVLDNPFEDPFGRPHSPDPWLTFSHEPAEKTTDFIDDQPKQMPEEAPSEHPYPEESNSLYLSSKSPEVDPLDTKSASQEEEEGPEVLIPQSRLASQQDTPSSQHPSPITSPNIPTPKSISTTLPPSSDSETTLPSSDSQPSGTVNSTLATATPVSELPSLPQTESLLHASVVTQSTAAFTSSQSGFVSPLDNSYTNGGSSHPFATNAQETSGWASAPAMPYSPRDGWNNSLGFGTHAASSTMDNFGNGTFSKPVDEDKDEDDDDDDVPIAVRPFEPCEYTPIDPNFVAQKAGISCCGCGRR